MKKILLFTMSLLMIVSLVACTSDKNIDTSKDDVTIENNDSTTNKEPTNNESKNSITYSNMNDIKTIMEENEGYVIIDVRTEEEYVEGHIPGAINIDNESIVGVEPEELPDKNQLILIYCRSGNRSKQAAEKLANMGYTNIIEFGGIIDWDGEIVTGSLPNTLLLQFRLPMPDVLTYKYKLPKLGKNWVQHPTTWR